MPVRPIRSALGPLAAVALMLGAAACHPSGSSALERPSDPVVLTGDALPRVPGLAPSDVLAFNYVNGRWHQIPVQVDERHDVDIVNLNPKIDRDVAVPANVYSDPKTLVGADPNPSIDLDDEIVFMARDAGGKAPAGGDEPSGVLADSGFQITVTDPVDGGDTGFVYLFQRGSSKAGQGAGHDYVDYHFELEAGGTYPDNYVFQNEGDAVGDPPENPAPGLNPENSSVTTGVYSSTFEDRWINEEMRITTGGASGVDILDRDQNFLIYGGDPNHNDGVCGRTENTFAAGNGALITNIDGPVRGIREYMGANSGPFTSKRHVFYEARQDVFTFLRLHPAFAPDDVLDYSPDAIGMTYRNNLSARNRQGVTIDGQQDQVDLGPLGWEQVTGEQGTFTIVRDVEATPNIGKYSSSIDEEFEVTSLYDDRFDPDPPQCTGDSFALGTSGSVLKGGVNNTDPTREPTSAGLQKATAKRFQYYDGPTTGQVDAVQTAEQRNVWARNPLNTSYQPYT